MYIKIFINWKGNLSYFCLYFFGLKWLLIQDNREKKKRKKKKNEKSKAGKNMLRNGATVAMR